MSKDTHIYDIEYNYTFSISSSPSPSSSSDALAPLLFWIATSIDRPGQLYASSTSDLVTEQLKYPKWKGNFIERMGHANGGTFNFSSRFRPPLPLIYQNGNARNQQNKMTKGRGIQRRDLLVE